MTSLNSNQHFKAIQAAIAVVKDGYDSNHPREEYKIAGHLITPSGQALSGTNIWLSAFDDVKPDTRGRIKIGNASPTIHAEIAILFEAIKNNIAVDGSHLYMTDPPCPNCIKMLIAAGIKKIFIDHKGFRKGWYRRRHMDFKALSLGLTADSGVQTYMLKRFKGNDHARIRQIKPGVV